MTEESGSGHKPQKSQLRHVYEWYNCKCSLGTGSKCQIDAKRGLGPPVCLYRSTGDQLRGIINFIAHHPCLITTHRNFKPTIIGEKVADVDEVRSQPQHARLCHAVCADNKFDAGKWQFHLIDKRTVSYAMMLPRKHCFQSSYWTVSLSSSANPQITLLLNHDASGCWPHFRDTCAEEHRGV